MYNEFKIPGIGRNWRNNCISRVQRFYVVLPLDDIHDLRSFGSSQRIKCLPSSSHKVLLPNQSGNYRNFVVWFAQKLG